MSTVVTSNAEERLRLLQRDKVRITGHEFVFTINKKILGDEDIPVY